MVRLEKNTTPHLFLVALFATLACSGPATEDSPKIDDVLESDAGVERGERKTLFKREFRSMPRPPCLERRLPEELWPFGQISAFSALEKPITSRD